MKRLLTITGIILAFLLITFANIIGIGRESEAIQELINRGGYFILLLLFLFTLFPKTNEIKVDNLIKLCVLVGLFILMINVAWGSVILISSITLLLLDKNDFLNRK